MYFRSGGLPADEPPVEGEARARDTVVYDPLAGTTKARRGNSWGRPLDQRVDETHSLVYISDPLNGDVEVTGSPRAVLVVSSTAEITLFVVNLCDVAPDGTSASVTKGYLNVVHRRSHSDPSTIEPSETSGSRWNYWHVPSVSGRDIASGLM